MKARLRHRGSRSGGEEVCVRACACVCVVCVRVCVRVCVLAAKAQYGRGGSGKGKGQVYTQHSDSAGPSCCEVGRGGGLKAYLLPKSSVLQ